MFTQTGSTQIEASVSAQNESGQAKSKSQEWGQGFYETPDLQRQRNAPVLDIKGLREKQTDRRTMYCRDPSTTAYDSASSKDSHNRRKISGNIYYF